MVLSEIGGFFVVMGTIGMIYPRIIKRIKMAKKTEAEYYLEKFNRDTPTHEKRTSTRDVIFGCFAIAGAITLFVGIIIS